MPFNLTEWAAEVKERLQTWAQSPKDTWRDAGTHTLFGFLATMTLFPLVEALARGDINVAYICLIPAINAYANAKVPLKVVSGTHRYGYGLIVNPAKIKTVDDLQRPGIRIGCPREGSPLDALLHKAITRYHLDKSDILKKIRRMAPAKVFLAMNLGGVILGIPAGILAYLITKHLMIKIRLQKIKKSGTNN